MLEALERDEKKCKRFSPASRSTLMKLITMILDDSIQNHRDLAYR